MSDCRQDFVGHVQNLVSYYPIGGGVISQPRWSCWVVEWSWVIAPWPSIIYIPKCLLSISKMILSKWYKRNILLHNIRYQRIQSLKRSRKLIFFSSYSNNVAFFCKRDLVIWIEEKQSCHNKQLRFSLALFIPNNQNYDGRRKNVPQLSRRLIYFSPAIFRSFLKVSKEQVILVILLLMMWK